MAVNDHARIGFPATHANEKQGRAIAQLHAAYYAALGITIRRLLTDNGSAFCSKPSFRLASSSASPGDAHAHTGRRPRQTRAVHPVSAQDMGRSRHLPTLGLKYRRLRLLDAPLQLASLSPRHRRHSARLQTECAGG